MRAVGLVAMLLLAAATVCSSARDLQASATPAIVNGELDGGIKLC